MFLDFFGFTTITNSVCNIVSYIAFVAIIAGALSERYRNMLIVSGAVILAAYAEIFLKNPLFAALQALIIVSGILQWAKLRRYYAMIIMIMLTAAVYVFLYLSGAIADGYALIGSFGLLGIAFGLVILPKHYGFLFMAAGGLLLVIYAFHTAAWGFFFLYIFFSIANMHAWQKIRRTAT